MHGGMAQAVRGTVYVLSPEHVVKLCTVMCTRHATFCVCPIHANCVASTTGHVDAGVAGKAYQVAVSVSIVTSIPSVPKKKKILRVATTQQILVVLVESWI